MKNIECCNQSCRQGRDCPLRKRPKREKADALSLADDLERYVWLRVSSRVGYTIEAAASELRIQHDLINQLEQQIACDGETIAKLAARVKELEESQ